MKNFAIYCTGCALIFVGLALLLSGELIWCVLSVFYFLALHFIGQRYFNRFWVRFWRICARYGTIR